MIGLDGEGVVRRIRLLAAQQAPTRPEVHADADDGDLEAAVAAVLDTVTRDRRLRRHLRDDRLRGMAEALIRWEVVVAAVGQAAAERRYERLVGREPAADGTGQEVAAPAAPPVPGADPRGASMPARAVARRPRRVDEPVVADPAVLEELSEAVSVEANPDDDPRKHLGFDHAVWLEEWLEPTIGSAAFDRLEAAVAAHPQVIAALHEDRELLFVSAPGLHPDDVRAVVIEALAGQLGGAPPP